MKDRVIARQELYEQVWTTPMSRLCVEYGLSDNGLRKICKALSVPTPPPGYWQKLTNNKTVKRPALKAVAKRTDYVITSRPRQAKATLDPDLRQALVADLEEEGNEDNRIVVSEPAGWHPAVAALRQAVLKAARSWEKRRETHDARKSSRKEGRPSRSLDDWELDRFANNGTLLSVSNAFRVAVGEHERALTILHVICVAAEQRGYKVEPPQDNVGRLVIVRSGINVYLRMVSGLEYSKEPDRRFGGIFAGHMRRVSTPTGKLRLHISLGNHCYAYERKFSDEQGLPLESQLNTVFGYIHKAVAQRCARNRQDKIEAELSEQRRIAREAEKARLEEERRLEAIAAAEREKIEQERLARELALIAEAGRWRQAVDLRMYVEHLTNAESQMSTELVSWISWAQGVATRLDPTAGRLACFSGPRREPDRGDEVLESVSVTADNPRDELASVPQE
ncbi:cell envelope integrity protein TolA [Bordetella genomosp. 9]|uniref:cell envelope integrity protein TolA n=1 Tax=Bordetella genomosp. 9 TaxID=1416803 RepID=UPI001177BDD2|nr:hypothetical protein [Bordetella genomosp. 9]